MYLIFIFIGDVYVYSYIEKIVSDYWVGYGYVMLLFDYFIKRGFFL